LAHDIVGLVLALLRGFDSGSFVEVSFVVNIKSLEGIGQGKDFVLLELRKLPIMARSVWRGNPRDPE
jgi:hypothetical protein